MYKLTPLSPKGSTQPRYIGGRPDFSMGYNILDSYEYGVDFGSSDEEQPTSGEKMPPEPAPTPAPPAPAPPVKRENPRS